METLIQKHHFGSLILLLFSFTASYRDFETPKNPSISYTYTRFVEIEKHCGFVIQLASELEPDDNRGDRMKKELFFVNGDWNQENGGATLMPFDGHDNPDTFGYGAAFKSVSFWVMDVDPIRRAKNAASTSGILTIGLSRSSLYFYKPYEWSPKFRMVQGSSSLAIPFKGIYTESDENGRERVMCLLGNATMPMSQFDESMESMNVYGYGYKHKLPLLSDDQIILVLKYPKAFTLMTRGISGEMKCLNQKWSLTYFDKVNISSQLGHNLKYHFGSEELLSQACSPYPYRDDLIDEDIKMFTGEAFCERILSFVTNEVFSFVPNLENYVVYDHKMAHLFFLWRTRPFIGA